MKRFGVIVLAIGCWASAAQAWVVGSGECWNTNPGQYGLSYVISKINEGEGIADISFSYSGDCPCSGTVTSRAVDINGGIYDVNIYGATIALRQGGTVRNLRFQNSTLEIDGDAQGAEQLAFRRGGLYMDAHNDIRFCNFYGTTIGVLSTNEFINCVFSNATLTMGDHNKLLADCTWVPSGTSTIHMGSENLLNGVERAHLTGAHSNSIENCRLFSVNLGDDNLFRWNAVTSAVQCLFSNNNTILGSTFAGTDNAYVTLQGNDNLFRENKVYSNRGVKVTGNLNRLFANWIGVAPDGQSSWPVALNGIDIQGDHNQIGDAATPADRNVIAGYSRLDTTYAGIFAWGVSNIIENNYVGILPDGATPVTNRGWGIRQGSYTFGTRIGGTNLAARNWIAGNARGGIGIDSGACLIQNNSIGVLPSGQGVGNGYYADTHGIYGGGDWLWVLDNIIAGHTNGYGAYLYNGAQVVFQGNRVGVDASTTNVIANKLGGLYIYSTNALIGGNDVATRNYFAGSTAAASNYGAVVLAYATGVRVQGNYVGVAADGSNVTGNASHGIMLSGSSSCSIGGTNAGEENVISGSGGAGIALYGSHWNILVNNRLGCTASGNARAGQGNWIGLQLHNSSSNHIGLGADFPRNVVLGNRSHGIALFNQSRGNHVRGNLVGPTLNGKNAFGNGGHGIYLEGATAYYAEHNRIGATNADDWAGGNVICCNASNGIHCATRAQYNRIDGNMIGVGTNGHEFFFGNNGNGVYLYGNYNNVGSNRFNVIAGNNKDGIRLDTASWSHIYNNYIGMTLFGASNNPNYGNGIAMINNALYNHVGFSRDTGVNRIGGNVENGIYIGSGCNGNYIQGNMIGVAVDYGNFGVNEGAGIYVANNNNNWIGDVGTNKGGNIINGHTGVVFEGISGCWMYDNYIGTDPGGYMVSTCLQVGIQISGCSGGTFGQFDTTNYVSAAQDAAVLIKDGSYNCRFSYSKIGVLYSNSGDGIVVSNAGPNNIGPNNLVRGSRVGVAFYDCPSNNLYGCMIGATSAVEAAWWWGHANREAGVRLARTRGMRVGYVFGSSSFQNTIAGNDSNGIEVLGCEGIQIQGNAIGMNQAGTEPLPNQGHGIYVEGATNILIGYTSAAYRNQIGGNELNGIHVCPQEFPGAAIVRGNRIGVATDGSTAISNNGFGIVLDNVAAIQVGGWNQGERNLIAGNMGGGVLITGALAQANLLLNNYIGTDSSATGLVPNALQGVLIAGAPNNIVGSPAAPNVIGGNGAEGVRIQGLAATNNRLEGNWIGFNASAFRPLPNAWSGVAIMDAPANTVRANLIGGNGGQGVFIADSAYPDVSRFNRVESNLVGVGANWWPMPNANSGVTISNACFNYVGLGNIIGWNATNGVEVLDIGAHDNFIQGNLIGVAPTMTNPMPNHSHGVLLFGGDSQRVGSTNGWEANVIAFNGSNGVSVARGVCNRVLGNSIFSNTFMGINLGTAGVNQAEQDGVPNRYQRFPILTNVFRGSTHIYGFLQTGSNAEYHVEFFVTETNNPAGYGEGKMMIGRTDLYTDAAGRAPLAIVYPFSMPTGWIMTATATDTNGNTSEFTYLPATIRDAPDSNGDGIPDFYQAIYTNLNQAITNDYDGDGMTDRAEYLAGTNPEDDASLLEVQTGSLVIPATSQGREYVVESTTNLLDPAWAYYTQSTGTDAALEFELPAATNAAAATAYRVWGGFP